MSKFYINYNIVVQTPEHMAVTKVDVDGTTYKYLPHDKVYTFTSKAKAIRFIYMIVAKGYNLRVPKELKWFYSDAIMKRVKLITHKEKK